MFNSAGFSVALKTDFFTGTIPRHLAKKHDLVVSTHEGDTLNGILKRTTLHDPSIANFPRSIPDAIPGLAPRKIYRCLVDRCTDPVYISWESIRKHARKVHQAMPEVCRDEDEWAYVLPTGNTTGRLQHFVGVESYLPDKHDVHGPSSETKEDMLRGWFNDLNDMSLTSAKTAFKPDEHGDQDKWLQKSSAYPGIIPRTVAPADRLCIQASE